MDQWLSMISHRTTDNLGFTSTAISIAAFGKHLNFFLLQRYQQIGVLLSKQQHRLTLQANDWGFKKERIKGQSLQTRFHRLTNRSDQQDKKTLLLLVERLEPNHSLTRSSSKEVGWLLLGMAALS